MRNKFDKQTYFCLCFGNQTLESTFGLLLVVGAFSLQNVVEMLEEVVAGWREVRWIWWMRQNLEAQFGQLLKHWLWKVKSDLIMEKNWAQSVDQCWLQALQFLVLLTDLLSTLLRCNNFIWIQKAVADQTGRRLPNNDHDISLVQVWLWDVLWSFSQPGH